MASKALSIIKNILGIASIIITIICIVWLVKIKNNAHNEPLNRGYYIEDDPINYYSEGDFCYDKSRTYEYGGVFTTFDIRMNKIKKYSKALLGTYFIELFLSFFILLLFFLYYICCENSICIACLFFLIGLLSLINSILKIVFFIKLSINYYKGELDEFEDFSKCLYLNQSFRVDYHFVWVVKDNFIKFFILFIINIILDFIDYILNFIIKCRIKRKKR